MSHFSDLFKGIHQWVYRALNHSKGLLKETKEEFWRIIMFVCMHAKLKLHTNMLKPDTFTMLYECLRTSTCTSMHLRGSMAASSTNKVIFSSIFACFPDFFPAFQNRKTETQKKDRKAGKRNFRLSETSLFENHCRSSNLSPTPAAPTNHFVDSKEGLSLDKLNLKLIIRSKFKRNIKHIFNAKGHYPQET